MTDLSCSLCAASSRLLCFKDIMCGYSAELETVQLMRVQSNWPLSLCRVGSCAQSVCSVFERRSTRRAARNQQCFVRTGPGKPGDSCSGRSGSVRDALYRSYR